MSIKRWAVIEVEDLDCCLVGTFDSRSAAFAAAGIVCDRVGRSLNVVVRYKVIDLAAEMSEEFKEALQ